MSDTKTIPGVGTIDLDYRKNPARWPAEYQACCRAEREQKPMCIYVAPPGKGSMPSPGFNTWFVRSREEGVPDGAVLVQEVSPIFGKAAK